MEAIANPPAYDRARAAVRYDDVARALVLAFKYSDRLDLAPMMGRWMARAGRELLDRGRRAAAGAAALAQALGAALQSVGGMLAAAISQPTGRTGAACALKRVRATPQQVGLSKAQARGQRAGRLSRAAGGKKPMSPADAAC